MRLLVRSIKVEAEGILSFDLVHPNRVTLPPFAPGSHIDVATFHGELRQYSLCGDPSVRNRYRIAVLREPVGRGGSCFMHDRVRVGDLLEVSQPRNNFSLAADAERHLLIAGGIGITPILAMAYALQQTQVPYEVHYCTRTLARTAFHGELADLTRGAASFYHDDGDPARGLDVSALLRSVVEGTHVYCCGPGGLMRCVKEATAHWPCGAVHFEHFAPLSTDSSAASPAGEFEVELASSGAVHPIPAGQSILAVLRDAGLHLDSSCEAGVCGTCKTRCLVGTPDHRDYVLTDDERRDWIMLCVSRAAPGTRIVLDL